MERQPGRGPYLPGPAGRLQSLRDAGQPITPASLGLVDSGSGWGGTGGLQFCGHAPDAADPDFTSPAWIAALASFDALSFEDARLLLPHTLRTAAGQPFRKVPRLLTLVAALMPSPSGDAFAQLKDPEGQMCAALHRDVMEATEGQLGPRAVLLLQQVCVVSPCPGLCYLCVTADNVMKVFPATDPKQALLPAHVDATIMQLQGATHLTETEKAAAHAFQVLARPQPPMAPPGGLSQAQTSSQVHSQVRPTVQQPQPDPGFGVVAKSNVEDLASDGAGPHSGPSVPDCSAGNGGFGGCPGSAAGGTVLTGTMGQPAARKSVDQQHQQCQMQRGSHHQQRSQAKPASVLPDEVGDAGRGRWPGPAVGFLAAARPTVSTGSNASSMVSGGAGGGKRRRMLGLDEMDLDIDLGLDLDLDLCCDGAISNVKHQMQPQQLCPRSPLKSHNGRHLQQLQFPNQLQQSLSLQRQSQQQKGQGQWQQVQEPQEMPPPQQQRQQYGDSLQHHAESPPLGAQGAGTGTHRGGSHFLRCEADKAMPPPSRQGPHPQPGSMAIAHTVVANEGGFTAIEVVDTNLQHRRAAAAAANMMDDEDVMVAEEVPIFSVLGKRRADEQHLQAVHRSYPQPQLPNKELQQRPPLLPPQVLQQQRPSAPHLGRHHGARQSRPHQQPSGAAGPGAVARPGGASQIVNRGGTVSPVVRAPIELPRLPRYGGAGSAAPAATLSAARIEELKAAEHYLKSQREIESGVRPQEGCGPQVGEEVLKALAPAETAQPAQRPVTSALDLFYFQSQSPPQLQPQARQIKPQ